MECCGISYSHDIIMLHVPFFLQEGLWKAAFPVGTEVYCFGDFTSTLELLSLLRIQFVFVLMFVKL